MNITINRQSVCAGDDVTDHTFTYEINSKTSYSELFMYLINRRYFPTVSGNDVVWVMCCDAEDLVAWKTKENKLYSCCGDLQAPLARNHNLKNSATPAIFFRYYSATIK